MLVYNVYQLSLICGWYPVKLTSRSEYALLALLYLARHKPLDEFVSGEVIATSQSIPVKFLQQILLSLKQARYVQSSKGQHGGYRLAKPADKITIAEIVRLFDGALAPTESVSVYFYESTPISNEKKLIKMFKEIRDFVAEKLERTTLADIK
jgi:Rrf2 family transcriptional regulator, cysteine metabolism repressor